MPCFDFRRKIFQFLTGIAIGIQHPYYVGSRESLTLHLEDIVCIFQIHTPHLYFTASVQNR